MQNCEEEGGGIERRLRFKQFSMLGVREVVRCHWSHCASVFEVGETSKQLNLNEKTTLQQASNFSISGKRHESSSIKSSYIAS